MSAHRSGPAPDLTRDAGIDALPYGVVAAGARVLGDAWTLLIIRELLCGVRRFNDIHRGLPALSRSMLSLRLRELEKAGIVVRQALPDSVWHEYRLTRVGLRLRPVLAAIGSWADSRQRESAAIDQVSMLLAGLAESADLSAVPRRKVCIEFEFPWSRGWVHLEPRHIRSCVDVAETDVDLVVSTSVDVLDDLWHGRRDCRPTVAAGEINFRGPDYLADDFRHWFRRRPV